MKTLTCISCQQLYTEIQLATARTAATALRASAITRNRKATSVATSLCGVLPPNRSNFGARDSIIQAAMTPISKTADMHPKMRAASSIAGRR